MLRSHARLWLLLAFVMPAAVCAEEAPGLDDPLPVDASIQYRQLPNGMRYWIRPNTKPAGKVSMWLRIGSGSLNEDESQRGLAHMLEHLAFNGSRNFPAGTLIKRFEAAGLTFGAHQNATTSFRDTVYKLTLPGDAKTIDLGMLFFADVASRLTLEPEEVARERLVVLAERRARDNATKRAFNQQLVALAPGSRFSQRFPIGDEDVIRGATAEQLRAYYQKWYRPDNTVLMIAGDLDVDALDAMVRKHFGGWAEAKQPSADHAPGIQPYTGERAVIISEPGLVSADIDVATILPPRDLSRKQGYRDWLMHQLGTELINRRLRDQVLEGEAPFSSASVASDSSFGAMLVEARAKGGPREWERVLTAMLTELKRAREHGFSDAEFAYATSVLRADFARDKSAEHARSANRWLGTMAAALKEHRRPVSARQEHELLQELLPTISRADVEALVRSRHAPDNRTFTVALPKRKNVTAPTTEQVLKVVQAVESAPVAKLSERARPTTLALAEPVAGAVIERRTDPALKVTTATLANGVRVRIRPLAYKNDHASVRIVLAGGRVNETPENRGITEVAALPFKTPATDKLSSTDVQRILATKQVTVDGRDTAGALELDVAGSGTDLEDGFRLAHLLLTQARIEPAAFRAWQRQARARRANREGSVPEQLNDRVDAFMTSNDPRFRVLMPEEAGRLTLVDGQAWLDGMLATAPIEVAIVGDISSERALVLAAKYLGSLPKRPSAAGAYAQVRALAMAPGPYQAQVKVDTATPKAMVYVGWRGPNWQDARDWQVLDLAGRVLTARLFDEVRERRGLAYSIRARSSSNTLYHGNGRFRVSFVVDPLKADEAADVVEHVIDDFLRTGPTAEEMQTAREQATLSFRGALHQPSFWLDILSDLDYMGGDLIWVQQYLDDLNGYTHDDIVTVLQKYLRPDRFMRVIGAPARSFTVANEPAQESVAVN